MADVIHFRSGPSSAVSPGMARLLAMEARLLPPRSANRSRWLAAREARLLADTDAGTRVMCVSEPGPQWTIFLGRHDGTRVPGGPEHVVPGGADAAGAAWVYAEALAGQYGVTFNGLGSAWKTREQIEELEAEAEEGAIADTLREQAMIEAGGDTDLAVRALSSASMSLLIGSSAVSLIADNDVGDGPSAA